MTVLMCSSVLTKFPPSLSQPYTGPHEILSRNDKHITININGKKSCVSLDRVKPAFVFKDLPDTIPDPIISAESSHRHPMTTNMQTTKSGRWDEVEKLAYQLNEEAERTERLIRRLRTAIRGFSSGRPRGTTPADDRYIVLQARRNRRQTAGEIARHTTQATGRPISRFTVARRLHGGGLFARRPIRCVPLTPAHQRRRSLWCREHRNWRDNEWGRVLSLQMRADSV
ncbi:hypothetical protein TNCV_2817741 [Trichonephila clavipes]|nr:hypothetical protein TNCV_2817741 [Trichonephila clavipes]